MTKPSDGFTDFGGYPGWRSAAPGEADVLAVLARADEGSRELDGLVYCCLHGLIFRRVVVQEQPILYFVDPELGFEEPKTRFSPLTLSVDAAVDAIERGWHIAGMRFFENEGNWVVSLNPAADASVAGHQLAEYGIGTHRCLPIAITAANIGARFGTRRAAAPLVGAAGAGLTAFPR